jgi:hypothetical protein
LGQELFLQIKMTLSRPHEHIGTSSDTLAILRAEELQAYFQPWFRMNWSELFFLIYLLDYNRNQFI